MALGRKKPLIIPPPPVDAPKSVIASAARIDVAAAQWPQYRYTDEAWQREAWGFYETNGELSYTASYIGAAQSLVRFYARHVDENGVPQEEVTDDPDVAAFTSTMLGGPTMRGQIIRAISVGLTVAGACYLIGRAARVGHHDAWTVVATQFVRMYGGRVQVDFGMGQWESVDPNRDVVVKIWRANEQRPLLAQAPTRALLPSFALLQKLRMFMMSEVNSRIAAGGGLMFMPQELQFPGDADNNIPPGVQGVSQLVWEAAASNVEGHGTAAAIAPVIIEGPIDVIERIPKPIRFDIPLSDNAMAYREELIEDVARGMNVPSTIIEGAQEQNHWSSWWGTEEFTTKTIAPDSALIADALNRSIFYSYLMNKKKDPARFTLWYDLAPLHNTADKFTDTLNLYREGAVNLETLLASANYTLANAPDKKEFVVRQLWEVVKRDPNLLQSQGLREYLDIEIDDFAPELDALGPPPPPVPGRVPEARQVGTEPGASGNIELVDDLSASLVHTSPVLPVANAVVLAALAVAGRKLRSSRNEFRGMFKDHDPELLHTKIIVKSEGEAEELLAGAAFSTARQSLAPLGQDTEKLYQDLRRYTKGLLLSRVPHTPELLNAYLTSQES
jgi:hypothetical protein